MDSDQTQRLREAVRAAAAAGECLTISGGGSKSFYGRADAAGGRPQRRLDTTSHRGILHYQPTELVLTARSGTPLAEIEAVLAEQNQMLAFEPPHFGENATLGGMIATGLSGPRRPFAGSVRDHILGCRILNGRGEVLHFGGEVMKNVAGFDLSRLMVGAQGTLGVLLDVSLRVLPRPECEATLVCPFDCPEALAAMSRWRREPWPLSGLAYHDQSWLYLRLSGARAAVTGAAERLGWPAAADGPGFWERLREQRGRFFEFGPLGKRLWRLSVPPTAPPPELAGHWFYDWGGALRWLRSDESPERVFAAARAMGGHASLFRGSGDGRVFQPLPAPLAGLHRRLKQAFDPAALFNPGRLYPDL